MYTFFFYSVGKKHIHSTRLFICVWCFVCHKAAIINNSQSRTETRPLIILSWKYITQHWKCHIKFISITIYRGKKNSCILKCLHNSPKHWERCCLLCLFFTIIFGIHIYVSGLYWFSFWMQLINVSGRIQVH